MRQILKRCICTKRAKAFPPLTRERGKKLILIRREPALNESRGEEFLAIVKRNGITAGKFIFQISLSTFYLLICSEAAFSQTSSNPPALRAIVNSDRDGPIQPDGGLTLREAIEVINGTLPLDRLSTDERSNVLPGNSADGRSRIEFNLPPANTTIELTTPLPPLAVPVVVDGTTQPGYGQEPAPGQEPVPTPFPAPAPVPVYPPAPVRGLSYTKQQVSGASSCVPVRPPVPPVPPPEPPSPPPPPVRGLSFLKQQGSGGATEQGSKRAREHSQSQVPSPQSPATSFQFPIPKPVVVLKPASGVEVFRGLTVTSDGVTVRALNIYGFSSRRRGATANIPPADVFIGHPNDTATFGISGRARSPNSNPPKDVLVECNWLGLQRLGIPITSPETPNLSMGKQYQLFPVKPGHFQIYPIDETLPTRSAFGVYVFNSLGTTIRSNLIANHDGSGIITSTRASNLEITENILFANGYGGMPDAIRLEGDVSKTRVFSNLIRDNAGSAIYLFKTAGSIEVRQNQIISNGRQFEQAAIYLMGSDHQIINNQIAEQSGPGVVVAAYPNSDRNVILGNEFARLQGLSIDLVTQMNADIYAYAVGDGPNPRNRSLQRRRKTGNFGIDAPRFVSTEFFLDPKNGSVTLLGTAKPGSRVEIYRVNEDTETRGPLSLAIAQTVTDEKGDFSITLPNLRAGERVSAIATDRESGTSEPAVNAVIRELTTY